MHTLRGRRCRSCIGRPWDAVSELVLRKVWVSDCIVTCVIKIPGASSICTALVGLEPSRSAAAMAGTASRSSVHTMPTNVAEAGVSWQVLLGMFASDTANA